MNRLFCSFLWFLVSDAKCLLQSSSQNKCFGNYFGVYLKLSFWQMYFFTKKKRINWNVLKKKKKKAIFLILLAVN